MELTEPRGTLSAPLPPLPAALVAELDRQRAPVVIHERGCLVLRGVCNCRSVRLEPPARA